MYRIVKREKIDVKDVGIHHYKYIIVKWTVYILQWKLEDDNIGYWKDHPQAPEFNTPEIAMEWWKEYQKLKEDEEIIKLIL